MTRRTQRAWISALAVMMSVGLGAAAEEGNEVTLHRIDGVCPYGHEELWEVPVVYGSLHRTEEVERKIREWEIIPGVCSFPDPSPRAKTVCRRCGFQAVQMEKTVGGAASPGTWEVKRPGAALKAPARR